VSPPVARWHFLFDSGRGSASGYVGFAVVGLTLAFSVVCAAAVGGSSYLISAKLQLSSPWW
jgi:hypothetical protein